MSRLFQPNDGASISVDVIVIGGGLAGSLTTLLLGQAGYQVALIDPHPVYPPDFRAEQLVGSQVKTLHRLGLLDVLVHGLTPANRAVAVRAERVVGVEIAPHYGIPYECMVNRARQHLPASVQLITSQAATINLTADRQRVSLCDGRLIEGRLVVLATGLGQRLLSHLHVNRAVLQDEQSLAFGFNVEVGAPELFHASVLVAYGERLTDRISYLTIFAIENRLRANLFTYHERHDPWVRHFVQHPREALLQALPCLEKKLGGMRVLGPVQMRVNHLSVAAGHRQAGLVLIGDAFQTSCPAAGTGISRLLNDVERLCDLAPGWLATTGMMTDKICQFYDDPIKQSYDAEALHSAVYMRGFATESSLGWSVHRQRVAWQRQLQLAFAALTLRRGVLKAGADGVDLSAPLAAATTQSSSRPIREW